MSKISFHILLNVFKIITENMFIIIFVQTRFSWNSKQDFLKIWNEHQKVIESLNETILKIKNEIKIAVENKDFLTAHIFHTSGTVMND